MGSSKGIIFVLLKQETAHSLEPPAYPHVLRIVEIRPTGIAILEGSDAARCSRQLKDVAHCPLPILDTNTHRPDTPADTTVALQYIARDVGEGAMAPRWCSAMAPRRDIISGVWIHHC